VNRRALVFMVPAIFALAAAGAAAPSGAAPSAAAPTIRGDYLEARTADVYTGPCFANSEVNLTGKEAILAWSVRDGGWDGVPLAGLSVVAVVRAGSTLGDPFGGAYAARSLLVVDRRADAVQRRALEAFARAMAAGLLDQVVAVEAAPIAARFGRGTGFAEVAVEGLAEVRTRALDHGDHLCGNEIVYYPPLTATAAARPAATLANRFDGAGLGKTWSSPGKRSAFVGTFTR
jgi:hypothetical protein